MTFRLIEFIVCPCVFVCFSASQRTALAEKELSDVNEKLDSDKSTRNQTNDAPPIMDAPLDVMGRPTLQLELAAKEKEVTSCASLCSLIHSVGHLFWRFSIDPAAASWLQQAFVTPNQHQ